jgi:hypothetical protein
VRSRSCARRLADGAGLKLFGEPRTPADGGGALLWTRDEQAARALFKSRPRRRGPSASLDPEDPQFYNAAQSAMQLRVELIQAIAQYDPKLALEYLRATRPPHADALRPPATDSQEQQLELSLASRVASQDPARASHGRAESVEGP